ncbi:MAG: hypothetical protein D6701_03025, partial [Gemmatimonadetes bacterium]
AALPTGETVAEDRAGLRLQRTVVAGRTVVLPEGGLILDAAVDTVRRQLYLSNHDRDRIEVFKLDTEQFTEAVPVGSEPWGLWLNRAGDTLLVANSGGTNVSNVALGATDGSEVPREDPLRRFLTPDVVLFDVETRIDDAGQVRYLVTFIPDAQPPGFSDRPQFLAVDSTGRILYSTKVTELGDFGTIRKAFVPAGGVDPEVVILTDHATLTSNPDFSAIGNVDDVFAGTFSDGVGNITIVDHTPGDLSSTVTFGPDTLDTAANAAIGGGSDIVFIPGARWSVPALGFSDTTFVTASGDGGWVVFGEGSVEPVGRIIMYEAGADRVSDVIEVTDLMTNAGETVRGLGLNYDGTLGVARGFQAYFFTTDLRLQGVGDLPDGGAGAVLHPLHANAVSLSNPTGVYDPNTHLAFLGTGEHTIDIIDTFHFFRSGRIFIRDVVSGPLRATLPFPEDNAGLTCATTPVFDQVGNFIGDAIEIFEAGNFQMPHPAQGGPTEDACVVVKLFGVTDSGGVVTINVRKSDVLRNHPSRQP